MPLPWLFVFFLIFFFFFCVWLLVSSFFIKGFLSGSCVSVKVKGVKILW